MWRQTGNSFRCPVLEPDTVIRCIHNLIFRSATIENSVLWGRRVGCISWLRVVTKAIPLTALLLWYRSVKGCVITQNMYNIFHLRVKAVSFIWKCNFFPVIISTGRTRSECTRSQVVVLPASFRWVPAHHLIEKPWARHFRFMTF